MADPDISVSGMPLSGSVVCPSCGDTRCALVGPIPNSKSFAGRNLSSPISGGEFYRCGTCFLSFRYPHPEIEELDKLYMLGDGMAWKCNPAARKDWGIATDWIRSTMPAGATVVDIGCSEGEFLEFLGQGYRLFGVEAHKDASASAAAKGIAIVGHDFHTISSLGAMYDCTVAFDVIEHVLDPARFLADLCKITRPGGAIVIATGNTDAKSWRLMGSRYWYSAISEHISFLNLQWCKRVARNLDLCVERWWFYSHSSVWFLRRWRETLINIIYRYWPGGIKRLRWLGFGIIDVKLNPELSDYPPGWTSARDHMLVIFRKSESKLI